MVQIQCKDARLDTLSDELCQVNTYVNHIARRQAHLSGFTASPSPSPEASKDENADDGTGDDDDDGTSDDDDDEDEDEECQLFQ